MESLVEKEKDLIGFANKVISFRMNVIKACKAKGITPPTNEQISDYINGYGFHFEDFMADYTEHEGIFRGLKTPYEMFKEEVDNIQWGEKPTEEEIMAFFNENGNNIDLFFRQYLINRMQPLERKVYLAAMGLKDEELVKLWNIFIDESSLYGEDSRVYDLANVKDYDFLDEHMTAEEILATCKLITNDNVRYIQWLSLNDKSIKAVKSIKSLITAYWSEIYDRILLFPTCYDNFFSNFVWPIFKKELGLKLL